MSTAVKEAKIIAGTVGSSYFYISHLIYSPM